MPTSEDPASAMPLRILIVIAQYPPHHLGGYELRCRDTARELARRGHSVTVLTSDVGASGVQDDEGVRVVRGLHLYRHGVQGRGGTLRFVRTTGRDCALFREELSRSGADVVHFWHMAGLTSALLAVPLPRGCGVLCDVSSVWLEDVAGTGGNWFRLWEKRAGSAWKRAVKACLRPVVGTLFGVPVTRPPWPPGPCYFTSEVMRGRSVDAGIDVADAELIDSGVDLETFRFATDRDYAGDVTVLFLSRLKRWKGLHTVVRALAELPDRFRLLAHGAVDDAEYLEEVRALARELGVADRFELADPVPHAEIANVLAAGHVLVFPSEQDEPFSRMVLEGFAVGTPVVGTTCGGTGKVLRDGDTGLVFPPGDSEALATQLRRVVEDAALRESVSDAGRALVEERYSLKATVTHIERMLRGAASGE